MSIVDVDVLLQELSPDAPCGPNLEYDAAFLELEKSVQGKPEVQYGKTIVAAEPPDWKQVKKQALALLERSRDLRAAMPLVRALLALHSVPGFANGVHLLDRLIAERWDSVHPQLDPDDDLDPLLRINSLAQLADAATVVREIKEAAFIHLPVLGPLSVRALEIAAGEVPVAAGQTALAQSSIDAALRDVPADVLRESAAAVGLAHDSIVRIEEALVRHAGSARALNLSVLTRQLRRMRDLLANHLPQTEEPQAMPDDDIAEPVAGAAPAASAGTTASAAITGDINSRADVVRMLDKILGYYARNEPSSPVPMLLERAKRLAPKNFFEIMEELAPESVAQLKILRGPEQA